MFKDIKGMRSGRLVAVRRIKNSKGHGYKWLCQCDCGNTKKIRIDAITSSRVKSCGCLQKEWAAKGLAFKKHGNSTSKTYASWQGMKSRCYSPKNKDYRHYGGRGIAVSPQWVDSYETFVADMGEASKGMTIERIDCNKDYTKENCTWVHKSKQNNNKRTSIIVEWGGDKMCLMELSIKTGVNYDYIRYRLQNKGMELKEIIKEAAS